MVNQVGRRRAPKPVPGLASIADRALQDADLPQETKEQFKTLFRQLEHYLRTANQSSYLGLPAPHSGTHGPDGDDPYLHADEHLPSGSDALTTEAPSGDQFDHIPAEGSANAFSRADHVHSRPEARQVASSLSRQALKDDILYLAGIKPWANVYAHGNFS